MLSEGPTFPVHIQQTGLKPTYIDSVAVLADVSIRVSVLNRHPTLDYNAVFDFTHYGEQPLERDTDCTDVSSVEVHTIYSDDLAAKVKSPHMSIAE